MRGHDGRKALRGLTYGWYRVGNLRDGSLSICFLLFQIVSGPTQEKLAPLSFLMLGNQVQPGGAGKEWVGSKGEGPISRVEGTWGCGCEAEA